VVTVWVAARVAVARVVMTLACPRLRRTRKSCRTSRSKWACVYYTTTQLEDKQGRDTKTNRDKLAGGALLGSRLHGAAST
jgi:hypothetical protein